MNAARLSWAAKIISRPELGGQPVLGINPLAEWRGLPALQKKRSKGFKNLKIMMRS